jgi:2-polyprenyl-3-methyl-5-hydroxy-6-metoxy-1,4-benzoquinol methylase
MNDPYRRIAGIYDRVFDRMNQGQRLAGMRMFRPAKEMNVLDVGCGTGSHLEQYRRFGCDVFGIDL